MFYNRKKHLWRYKMNEHWIAGWGCAITHPTRRCAEWIKDTTVRMQMQMTVPGSCLKFQFSNLFGEYEAVIARASVSVAKAPKEHAIDIDRCVPVTFDGGKAEGHMAPGGFLTSDPVEFDLHAGEILVLNLYFDDFTQLTSCHRGSETFMEKWCCYGDQTFAEELPFGMEASADVFPFIHTIEVLAPENCYSIVAFGDSITSQTWPDRLKRRVMEMGREDVAIIRKGIGGSRVLHEYSARSLNHFGPKGLDRFEREVLLPGVKKVFILHGINDIIHPNGRKYRPMTEMPTAEELIEGLQYYVDTAHAHGIAVFLSPILPFEGYSCYDEDREAIREKVNYWIYREAPVEGVLPFEVAVLDLDNPIALRKECDSGDHLHPSGDGAQSMAESIPEEFI